MSWTHWVIDSSVTNTSLQTARMMVSRSRRPRVVGPLAERLGIATIIPCGSVGVKVARVAMTEADRLWAGQVLAAEPLASATTVAAPVVGSSIGGQLTQLVLGLLLVLGLIYVVFVLGVLGLAGTSGQLR